MRYRSTISFKSLLAALLLTISGALVNAQQLLPDLGSIDGVDLTPDNILGYGIVNGGSQPVAVTIRGRIRYRESDLTMGYRLEATLAPGFNRVASLGGKPVWEFSRSALKELFFQYRLLPQGTYEYCVEVAKKGGGDGGDGSGGSDCLFRQSKDLFMISLLEPDDDAKIYEYHPLLSWVCNYPLGSALTYRLRIAEVKEGQNNYNALTRNNPVYSEKNLAATSRLYPAYAKALKPFQPYAWTVDAYYKGILLGGAEPWRFTIVEDSLLLASVPRYQSYLDLEKESGKTSFFAPGILKLKYELRDLRADSLRLRLFAADPEPKEIALRNNVLIARLGDNRYELDLQQERELKHMQLYRLQVTNGKNEKYNIAFRYINPEYLN